MMKAQNGKEIKDETLGREIHVYFNKELPELTSLLLPVYSALRWQFVDLMRFVFCLLHNNDKFILINIK